MTSDFILEQDLAMLTKGLKFKANFSMDYTFVENKRGINDQYHNSQRMWVDPNTGDVLLEQKTQMPAWMQFSILFFGNINQEV